MNDVQKVCCTTVTSHKTWATPLTTSSVSSICTSKSARAYSDWSHVKRGKVGRTLAWSGYIVSGHEFERVRYILDSPTVQWSKRDVLYNHLGWLRSIVYFPEVDILIWRRLFVHPTHLVFGLRLCFVSAARLGCVCGDGAYRCGLKETTMISSLSMSHTGKAFQKWMWRKQTLTRGLPTQSYS